MKLGSANSMFSVDSGMEFDAFLLTPEVLIDQTHTDI